MPSLNLSCRLASTALALPVAVFAFGNALSRLLCGVVVAAACAWEYQRLRGAARPLRALHAGLGALLLLAGVCGAAALCGATFFSLLLVLTLFLCRHSHAPKPSPALMADFAAELFGVVYIGFFLAHAAWFNWCSFGVHLLLYVLVVTFAAENAALFLGWAFGRHRPVPALSPNKTSLGYFGGMVGSCAASYGFGAVMQRHFGAVQFPLVGTPELLVCGLCLGVAGAVGDLLESFLKRCYNLKDAGVIFPGWGGVLDRLDGVLLNIPLLYYLLVGLEPSAYAAACPQQSGALFFTR